MCAGGSYQLVARLSAVSQKNLVICTGLAQQRAKGEVEDEEEDEDFKDEDVDDDVEEAVDDEDEEEAEEEEEVFYVCPDLFASASQSYK